MCFIGEEQVELERLKTDVKDSQKAVFASTRKNLITQWMSFLLFCMHFKLEFLPAEEETMALYAQFLSRSLKSVSSICNYLSGGRLLHLFVGARVRIQT